MPLSTTETIGFCDQFVRLLQDNQNLLKNKGLDVSNWISEITGLKDDAVQKDAEQDEMKAAAKAKTREAQTAVKLAYRTSSTKLDAVIGVLGKDTPAAKQASRLRSSLIAPPRHKSNHSENP